jgi:dTDP-4-dehydrorhamnose reductase
MKILITGATGMLGRSVLRHLNEIGEYECVGTGFSRSQPPLRKVDLLNKEEVTNLIHDVQPRVIVHCAAERFPDRASQDPKRTLALNVDSTLHLAQECARIGAVMIYISTDYVFDGGVKSLVFPPYLPDSKTNPINLYGESKLSGEEAVLSVPAAKAVIVRVPVLYATDCYDLSESATLVIAKSLLSKSPTAIDNWGVRFPTLVDDVSIVLKSIIDATQRSNNPIENVQLHVSSSERCTKYELAKLMADLTHTDASHIKPNSDPPNGAPRPQNTQLDCDETWKLLEIQPYQFVSLREGIKSALVPFINHLKPTSS